MQRNRLLALHAIREVFAFQDSRNGVSGSQPYEPLRSKFRHPATVEIDDCYLRIENLKNLLLVGFCVLQHLIFGELLPRDGSPGWIADQGREIADHENRHVPKILKVLHLPD